MDHLIGPHRLHFLRLYWPRKNGFYEGHGFSRALAGWVDEGFRP
jgi:hypothetical protein